MLTKVGVVKINGERLALLSDQFSSLSAHSLFGLSLGFFSSFFGSCVFGIEPLVLLSDLIKLFHVLLEILASLESNEKFGLLAVSLLPLNCNCFGSDLFEGGVLVSKQITI